MPRFETTVFEILEQRFFGTYALFGENEKKSVREYETVGILYAPSLICATVEKVRICKRAYTSMKLIFLPKGLTGVRNDASLNTYIGI